MFHVLFGSIMLVATLITTVPDYPTLAELAKEADRIRSGQPEVWQNYVAEKERAIADHRKLTSNWRQRGMPPRLDFQPLKFPLAFLVVEVQQANPPRVETAPFGGNQFQFRRPSH